MSNLDMSLAFYVTVVGFTVLYTRPEERFAYLYLAGANLMIEEVDGPSRFRTALLEHPFGRGVNFQIQVADIAGLLERMEASGHIPRTEATRGDSETRYACTIASTARTGSSNTVPRCCSVVLSADVCSVAAACANMDFASPISPFRPRKVSLNTW